MSIKVLQGMNCFIDGQEFIGVATKAAIIYPQPKMKEVASPGFAGMRKLQTGKWELEDLKVTLQDYPPQIIGLVGNPQSGEKPVQLIGAFGPQDPRTVTVTITGPWNTLEGEEWADDSDSSLSFGIYPEVYTLQIDGKEVVYYDCEAGEVRLNGQSMTADLNKRLKRTTGAV